MINMDGQKNQQVRIINSGGQMKEMAEYCISQCG